MFSIAFVYSQNHIEALRYSQQFYSSTAKSEAMGNSLSAVGADFSAYMINPAGIGVYKKSQMSLTPDFIINNTSGVLSNTNTKDGRFGFKFSNAAYVGVKKGKGIFKYVNYGIAYNSHNDYRQQTQVSAKNMNGSILDYIIYNSNNDRYSTFREDLAWRSWLINFDNSSNEYWSHVTDNAKYPNLQNKLIRTNGGAGEFSFSLGTNINDFLYLGGTIGLTSINYSYDAILTEKDFPVIKARINGTTDSVQINPEEIIYKESLETNGNGINAKFGFIFQPVKFLRIGGAIHSSTRIDFEDKYKTSMYVEYPTNFYGYSNYEPDTANVFDWVLKTPFRANAGVALILESYQLGKFYTVPMTFSLDYEYVDYSNAELRHAGEDSYTFVKENKDISNFYTKTHNIRAGAELNFGFLKVRGGYAIYSNPLIKEGMFENAKVIYSGGVGFASEHTYVDFSYSYASQNQKLYLYNANEVFPEDPMGNLTEPKANIKNTKQFVKVSFGIRF